MMRATSLYTMKHYIFTAYNILKESRLQNNIFI